MNARTFLLLSLVVLSTNIQAAAANPAPPDADALLKRAEKFYEDLEYTQALRLLLALQQVKEITPVQRARTYLYMGVCFTALGKAEHAVQSFIEMLKLRPRFRLPEGVSPSIRAMFSAALKQLKLPAVPPKDEAASSAKQAPVELQCRGPLKATAGAAIELALRLDDPDNRITSVVINWRRVGGEDYSRVTVKRQGGAKSLQATIPGATLGTKTGSLVYYVEAKDGAGKTVARDGDIDDPFEVQLQPARGASRAWAWWTLGIVGGAAAIAGSVVAIVMLSKGSGSQPTSGADVLVVVE